MGVFLFSFSLVCNSPYSLLSISVLLDNCLLRWQDWWPQDHITFQVLKATRFHKSPLPPVIQFSGALSTVTGFQNPRGSSQTRLMPGPTVHPLNQCGVYHSIQRWPHVVRSQPGPPMLAWWLHRSCLSREASHLPASSFSSLLRITVTSSGPTFQSCKC